MQTATQSISIIIPNYNGRALLEAYLPFTFMAADNACVPYEVIVVDDASRDDSILFLKENYPQIIVLQNANNQGFSATCNAGANAARNKLILFLNSDVKLTPDYFKYQFEYFLNEDTFGVMGQIIDMEDDHIQDVARMPGTKGVKLKTKYSYFSKNSGQNVYTYYLSGANALVDAAKLKQIGGFYELFSPFYYEDNELGLRAWRMGYKCYYEHNAVCRHHRSVSTKSYQSSKWIKGIYFRNRFYMHALHLDGVAYWAWFLQITFTDLLPKLIIGQFWIWGSYKSLIKNHKQIADYKTKLQALLKNKGRSVFEVIKLIEASVEHQSITKLTL